MEGGVDIEREKARELINFLTKSEKNLNYYTHVKDGEKQSDLNSADVGKESEHIRDLSEYGILYRDDHNDNTHQLSPLGDIFSDKFDEFLNITSELMTMADFVSSLPIQDSEFLNMNELKGGTTIYSSPADFGADNKRWNAHVRNSVVMKEIAPKRMVHSSYGANSPVDQAIHGDYPLERAKFIHSEQMRKVIEDDHDNHEEASRHETTDDCDVSYRVDKDGLVPFHQTFSIFDLVDIEEAEYPGNQDYPEGGKVVTIHVDSKGENPDVIPYIRKSKLGIAGGNPDVAPIPRRLLYEVTTDAAIEWAEDTFDELWEKLEPHSYNRSYQSRSDTWENSE